uniref:hypothetical protein n=1 Tax=Agathobacter sp. TaxID=2021311 RepID=UPI0040565660
MDISVKEILKEMERYKQEQDQISLESLLKEGGFEMPQELVQKYNESSLEKNQELQRIRETFPIKMPQSSVLKPAADITPAKNMSAKKRKSQAKQEVKEKTQQAQEMNKPLEQLEKPQQEIKLEAAKEKVQRIEREKENKTEEQMKNISPMLKAAREEQNRKAQEREEAQKTMRAMLKNEKRKIQKDIRFFLNIREIDMSMPKDLFIATEPLNDLVNGVLEPIDMTKFDLEQLKKIEVLFEDLKKQLDERLMLHDQKKFNQLLNMKELDELENVEEKEERQEKMKMLKEYIWDIIAALRSV